MTFSEPPSNRSNLIWWVLPGVIGGMPMPFVHPERRESMGGALDAYADELPELHAKGVRGLVCLLNHPSDEPVFRSAGFDFHLMSLRGGAPPTIEQAMKFLDFMEDQAVSKHPVAVHCEAGIGRTGTVIAIYLIAKGAAPEDAIRQIRSIQPQAIETKAQLDFLRTLPAALKTT